MKTIKCLLLNVDNVIITEVVEIDAELGDPDWMLVNPYRIDVNENMTPWPEVTNQRQMKILSDNVLTVVDPKPEIISKYMELTS